MITSHEYFVNTRRDDPDGLPWFVEFVGPGCSGKTTLLRCLKHYYEHEFTYIGAPSVTRIARVKSRLREEWFVRRMLRSYQLDAFSRSRLIKGFSKVSVALRWYATCQGDIFLVDEGPLRVLMDYAAHDETQYRLWRRFCLAALEALAGYRMLIVLVEADPGIRIERGKQRKAESRTSAPEHTPSVDVIGEVTKRWFFRDEAIRLIETGKFSNFHMVNLANDGDVWEVTLKARDLIRGVVLR